MVFDDSRARLEPKKGGLGYRGAWTTLEALHKTVQEHYKSLGDGSVRAENAGITLDFKIGFGWGRKKGVAGGGATVKGAGAVKEAASPIAGPVEVATLQ